MLTFNIESTDLQGRFDPTYYNPTALKVLRMLKRVASKKGAISGKFGSMAKLRKGIFSIHKEEYQDEGIPFIRVSEIKDFNINTGNLTYISKERALEEVSTLRTNDLIISKSGTVGTVALIPPDIDIASISQDVIGVKLKKDSPLSSEYIATFLSVSTGRSQILRGMTQQMQAHLNLTEARSILIVCPTEELHERVTTIVKKSQEERADARTLLKKSDAILSKVIDFHKPSETISSHFKSSELQIDSFCPKYYSPESRSLDNTFHKRFKKSIQLGELCDFKRGDYVGMANYQSSGVPFIRTSDFPDYEIDLSPDHYVSPKIASELNQDIRKGDILIAQDGKVGNCGMITVEDFPLVYVDHIVRLRIKPKYSSSYLLGYVIGFLMSRYARIQFNRFTVVQSTIPTLGKRLAQVVIPKLSKSDQRRIAKIVMKSYDLRASAKAKVKNAKTMILNSIK